MTLGFDAMTRLHQELTGGACQSDMKFAIFNRPRRPIERRTQVVYVRHPARDPHAQRRRPPVLVFDLEQRQHGLSMAPQRSIGFTSLAQFFERVASSALEQAMAWWL